MQEFRQLHIRTRQPHSPLRRVGRNNPVLGAAVTLLLACFSREVARAGTDLLDVGVSLQSSLFHLIQHEEHTAPLQTLSRSSKTIDVMI